MHDYAPDFIVRLEGAPQRHLILETKGHDPLKDVKRQAAERWVAAVNADGRVGQRRQELVDFDDAARPRRSPPVTDHVNRRLLHVVVTGLIQVKAA